MEHLYKLNLDYTKFSSLIIPAWNKEVEGKKGKYNVFKSALVKDFFSVEKFNICGIDWDICYYLKKSCGVSGTIHIDHYNGFWPSINLITSGVTHMEFWEHETLSDVVPYTFGNKDEPYKLKAFNTSKKCDKKYIIGPGIYLLNASIAHRSTVEQDERHLYTMRTWSLVNKNWEWITNEFKDILQVTPELSA